MSDRFRPVRAGIIGIWDYTHQEFRFEDGHLILRGPNGSGKTKALEVLVPFVLDGSIDPRRLDPFSGDERTMRSNLLFGDRRVGHGYCWVQFSRGSEHVTVGIGLRAQAQTTTVKRWFFVADGVVGETIDLLTPDRVPVTRSALEEQVGKAHVFKTRAEHQSAVDRRLYGLGEERYAALVNLMLTLRRPQLAKDLDPDAVSDVLSEGLRTVQPELLEASADAFDNLEQAQRRLTELDQAAKAVADLITHWRNYLRARARKRLENTRDKTERVRATEHEANEAELHIQRSAKLATKAHDLFLVHEQQCKALEARIEALKQHDAYRGQGQLDDARRAAESAERALDEATRRLAEAKGAQQQATDKLTHKRKHLRTMESDTKGALDKVRTTAELAGHPDAQGTDATTFEAWRAAAAVGVDALLELVQALEEAQTNEAAADRHALAAQTALHVAEEALRKAGNHLDHLLLNIEATLKGWHEALPTDLGAPLPLPVLTADLDQFGAALELGARVDAAWSEVRDHALHQRSTAQGQIVGLERSESDLVAKIEAIRQQHDDAPTPPAHRRASRTDRPGAPLWRLVQFRDDVPVHEQGHLEGALLAAGLLDAWVSPGAAPDDLEDAWLVPSPVDGPDLTSLLAPEVQSEVPVERIEATLRSIGLAHSSIRVGVDGRFQLGPLVGAYRPEQARYIGATARERHRAERIEALEAEVSQVREAMARAQEVVRAADDLLAAIRSAKAALPQAEPVRVARKALDNAQGARKSSHEAHQKAQQSLSDCKQATAKAHRTLLAGASEYRLPAEPRALRERKTHLVALQARLTDYKHASERLDAAQEAEEEARVAAAEREQATYRASSEVQAATTRHGAEAERYQALKDTLGKEVQEILASLATTATALAEEREAQEQAREDEQGHDRAKARHEAIKEEKERLLPGQRADLHEAEASLLPFQSIAIRNLLGVEDNEAPFAVRLGAALGDASFSEEQLKSTQTRIDNRLATFDEHLGTTFRSVRHTEDDLVMIAVHDEAGEHTLNFFQERVSHRLSVAQQLLDAQERALFEEAVLNSLCAQLRERIGEARTLVKAMDASMRSRMLASKKSVGIAWKSIDELDPERKELLGLLGYDVQFLTAERLGRIRTLLSSAVQSARRDKPDRSYLEILIEAVDYRQWHRFVLSMVDAHGTVSALTRRSHSRLSGGEKAATVHLPLFAAANAHFSAANATCPRLIALDEAFAGIDETGVPALLRLALEFDLDWFLTGHDLWVTESFLKGVMHYDLAHDPASGAISAWPIRWNGHETIEGEDNPL